MFLKLKKYIIHKTLKMKENSITIKRINSMSIDEKKKHKEKLKGYINNLKVINNQINSEIEYIHSLLLIINKK